MNTGFYLYRNDLKEPLAAEEQKRLFLLATQGDQKAKDVLFEHNLRLVKLILNRYYRHKSKEKQEELFSVGALGLWKAIEKFDISLEYDFSTYAIPTIFSEMRRFVRDDSTIKHSSTAKSLAYNILQIQEEYAQNHFGNELSLSEISEILKKDENEVFAILQSIKPLKNFSDPLYKHSKKDNNVTVADGIKDDIFSIDKELLQNELIDEIRLALGHFPEREQKIIRLLFGIDCQRKTQKEIAKMLGLTQSMISHILKKTLLRFPYYLSDSLKEQYQTDNSKNYEMPTESIYTLFPDYTKEEIHTALKLLTEKERQIILLRYPYEKTFEDYISTKEISNKLNISRTTYYKLLKSTIVKMTKILANLKKDVSNEDIVKTKILISYPYNTQSRNA